jgi:hypothetical protein
MPAISEKTIFAFCLSNAGVREESVLCFFNDRQKAINLLGVVAKALMCYLRLDRFIAILPTIWKANPIPWYYTSAKRLHKVRLWHAYSA